MKTEMKSPGKKAMLLFLFLAILGQATIVKSIPYDYSASLECLAEPLEPQYGGGILVNPDFNKNLNGWVSFGYANVMHKVSKSGNKYAVAVDRNMPHQSISQKVQLQKDKLYSISAWLQVDKGSVDVRMTVKTTTGYVTAGAVVAKASCWSMLKGGFTVNTSGPAEIYFETNNSTAEIWVDSASLQPFTLDEWRGHHNDTIHQERKKTVNITAVDAKGNPISGAKFTIDPVRPGFPFGTAINQAIISNPNYQRWFASRFTVTTFENEMKWYSTEYTPGHEDYSVADTMLAFAKQHGIQVRGHNVFWDDPNTQMAWVNQLNYVQLRQAVTKRLKSVVNKYKGQVIHWDVVNENVHFNFYENKFGADASTKIFQQVHRIDPNVVLFLNDYNTLEQPGDWNAAPDRYLQRFHQIRAGNPNARMAIGLESHFDVPNIPYMRAVLDKMASAGVPIWLTEVDVAGTDQNQAYYLEQILREGYSHPAVQGIVMWASWTPRGCYRMCLTDNQFRNFAVGDAVDKLIQEWKTRATGTTGADGSFQAHLAHGEYQVTVSHPSANTTSVHKIKVDAKSQPAHKLEIQH